MTGAPVTSGSTVRSSPHELLGALALPDVHVRVDLEEEAPVLADELAAELGGDVLDRDRARVQVALEAVELRHEVPVELAPAGSSARARPSRGRSVLQPLRSERPSARGWLASSAGSLLPASAATTSNRRLMSAQRLAEPLEVHRARAADPDRGHQGGEGLDDGDLLRLVIGDHAQHRVDLGDRRQAARRRACLSPQLVERAGARRGR